MTQVYKMFTLDSKKNFEIYLEFLIKNTNIHIKQYKRYIEHLNKTIETIGLADIENKKIKPEIYIDLRNMISRPQNMLLNLLADHTKSAASYNKFRTMVKKKNDSLELGLEELPSDVWNILSELNNTRNWSLHIPESLLISELEIERMAIEKRNVEFSSRNNPIINVEFDYYEATWIYSLYIETINLYEKFSKVFLQMKKDYSKLIGESMRMQNAYFDIRLIEDLDIQEISGLIQKSKYKGEFEDVWLDFVDIKPNRIG